MAELKQITTTFNPATGESRTTTTIREESSGSDVSPFEKIVTTILFFIALIVAFFHWLFS